jgi:hypothetical protein
VTRTFRETLAPVWSVYREIVCHQSETEGDWVGVWRERVRGGSDVQI